MKPLDKTPLQGNLLPFAPFPTAADRAGWQELEAVLRVELIRQGEDYLKFAYPQLLATDWLAFTRRGDRKDFEEKYFSRRRALAALVLAECAENEGRFLDDILNGIFAICEESGWQLPAHNSYVRNTVSEPLPDRQRPLLDLFACETAALLACTLYLLRIPLDNMSPAIAQRIEQELDTRIVRPYLGGWFWWMGGFGEPTLNWTIWCTQNVLLTVFLSKHSESLRRQTAEKAVESINYFLDDYGEDGCCDEGAQYYRHAGLCLFNALDILDRVTNGGYAAAFTEDKVRNIAHYIVNVHVDNDVYINFADCSPRAGRAGAREYLFGRRCSDEALCTLAVNDLNKTSVAAQDAVSGINLYYLAQAAFAAGEIKSHPAAPLIHEEVYYPSTGLFVARDKRYIVAAKGGGNDDNHNHNDTGSVTVYKDGRPVLIDIGVESYSAKTFSSERYDIWTMQSSWHNLPDFDGVMQVAGEDYCAKDVHTSFTSQKSEFTARLEQAWPLAANVKEYERTVTLLKGKAVEVTDRCAGGYTEAVMNLQFAQEPLITGDDIVLEGLAYLRVEGAAAMQFESVAVTDPRLRQAWPDRLYRVRIPFAGTLRIVIE